MNSFRSISLLITLLVLACNSAEKNGTLCERSFEPYADLITGQLRTAKNAAYLDAMASYTAKDYAGAAEGLKRYLAQRGAAKSAHLYLANCYIAMGKPYDAELEIDHLEISNMHDYKDQCEWYTVLCWLCSGQQERALMGARAIATAPRHTYTVEAKELEEALNEAVAK